ncbi:hypothetical protein ColTof4_01465 [Colletotrichum tofieldiae]|nr:hypothetical protein ColTof3_08721 [Colletotrichum tofieldiae]GKT69042.1 hypothetical protein ColTof4_01465 [Colletotrichum tofieldiae]
MHAVIAQVWSGRGQLVGVLVELEGLGEGGEVGFGGFSVFNPGDSVLCRAFCTLERWQVEVLILGVLRDGESPRDGAEIQTSHGPVEKQAAEAQKKPGAS